MRALRTRIFRVLIFAVLFMITGIGAVIGYAQIGLWSTQTGVPIEFNHDGVLRDYRIHVPSSLPEGTDVPLVLCFHGGGSNSRVASVMGLSQIADREGFIVVYPNAINKHWNDGRESPMFAEQDKKTDDVEFVLKIIERVRNEHAIDADRIFATGLSNGGFMSQRLAIEKPDVFAGVAVVIATMGEPISKRFAPQSPVSVMYLNGTEDPLAPYQGGPVGKGLGQRLNQVDGESEAPRGRAISTDEAVRLWRERNQLREEPRVTRLNDVDEKDGSRIEHRLWSGGERGTAVALYKVIGGGHGLPGGRQYLPVRVIGRVNQDVQGMELVWDFFKNHAREPIKNSTDSSAGVKEPTHKTNGELYFPGRTEWETVDLATAGCEERRLDSALDLAGSKHSKGVVVLYRGRILAEKYWDGWRRDQQHPAYSVSKSFVSSLVGIAIDDGEIEGVDQPASDFLSEWKSSPKHQAISLHDLLSMSGGLQGGKGNFIRGVLSQNERRFATRLPVQHDPGTHWDYHQSGYMLLHSILEEATGKSLSQYSQDKLFDRIGMQNTEWATKRFNRSQATFLRTTPRDAARYGLLVLANGNWDGEQVIDSEWLTTATRPANPRLNPSYGYLWWLNGGDWFWYPLVEQKQQREIFPGCPSDAFAALGKDDQKIYIVPSLDLVVTRFGDAADSTSPALTGFDATFLGAICESLGYRE